MDTQAAPWLQGIEVIGCRKLGDLKGIPVFRIEHRLGWELIAWAEAFPALDTWHEILGA